MPARSTIRLGSKGPDVTYWQTQALGMKHPAANGIFDAYTKAKTKLWQQAKGIDVDGVVGNQSWGALEGVVAPAPSKPPAAAPPSAPAFKFVQARNYRPGRVVPISWIVIHDIEGAESIKSAENVAAWFAGSSAPMASAHFCVDSDSVVQCVKEEDTAFAAPPCNPSGLHVELSGWAKQSAADWADEFSTAMLARAAALIAGLCQRHMIPPEFIDEAGLLKGRRGITTHACISRAFKKSTHLDPGPNFPLDVFIADVRARMAAT